MKILAIRGRNLASLRGDFAVDLAAEPLASAGLFAITGATGAGKSTLLDALCLALFDRTPRLDGGRGAKVGRADQDDAERVAARDVRGLLTRGQGSGFAEVDFTSRDGNRWRARWSVHRARERAEGRLQQQSLLLEGLDSGDRIGGTKTEVLDAIRDRVGLSFDQFRRSVLLAQGDFAAFLHAAAKARAELLEKVTGTAIYARVSEEAFARAKLEREARDDLARQRDQLGLLTPEVREELEQRLAAATAELDVAKQARAAADVAVRWYAELGSLRALEDAGAGAHQNATARWQASEARQAMLDLVKAAQPLRAAVEQLDTSTKRRDEAREQIAQRSDALETAGEAKTVAASKLTEAREAQETARHARESQAPLLARAASLDARIDSVTREVASATGLANDASARADEVSKKATALAADVAAEKTKRDAAIAWLEEHPGAQALSGAWDHLAAALREHADASRVVAAAGDGLPNCEEAVARTVASAEAAAKQARAAEEALARGQQAVTGAEAAIPPGRQQQLDARRRDHERRRDAVRRAEESLAAALRIQTAKQRAETTVEEARQRRQAALEQIDQTRGDLTAQAIRIDEAERALRASQAVVDLEDRRAELTDGEPCPLCGATDHPYRHGDSFRASEPLARQRQRVKQLREHGARLTATLATAEEQSKAAEDEAARHAGEAAEADEQMRTPTRSWQQAVAMLGLPVAEPSAPGAVDHDLLDLVLSDLGTPEMDLPGHPFDSGSETALAALRAAIDQALEGLQQHEETLRALESAAKESRTVRDAARQLRDERAAGRVEAEEKARAAAEALADVKRCQGEGEERLATALRSLATTLLTRTGWREQLETDSDAFRAACRDEVTAFARETAVRDRAGELLADLEPRAAAVAAEAVAAREAAVEQDGRRGEQAEVLADLRAEREALLGTQAVVAVERALREASAQAEQRFDAASEAEREVGAAWKAAEARLEVSRTQLRKESEALEAATRAVDDQLRAHEVDLETLRERLTRDAAWCEREGQALDEIRQAVRGAESVLAERRQRREAHEESGRPDVAEAEAADQQARATEGLEKADAAVQALQVAMRQDDTARDRGDALAAEITRQEVRYERWEKLNEVIGSHDGQKFRKFAQGLTLDALLGYANVHLRELAPRYHLDRVPGEDLELQVIDRDMGDEVRAINSLSGGETFLASLALALGLSSLSASDTPVESLFIDEGFGTLDLKTLETALSALDALQASGRQVGVISHVQDLGQRIGAQVRVIQLGAGRSRLETVGGF